MTADHKDPCNWVHGKDRKAMKALTKVYGDDVSEILNALHRISTRIAIGAGVEADVFAAGIKHHWDHVAERINDMAEPNVN